MVVVSIVFHSLNSGSFLQSAPSAVAGNFLLVKSKKGSFLFGDVAVTRGKNGQIDETAVENITFFIRFIAILYKNDKEGQLATQKAHSKFRNAKGSLPTFYMNADSITIKYTPVNNSFYIRVESLRA